MSTLGYQNPGAARARAYGQRAAQWKAGYGGRMSAYRSRWGNPVTYGRKFRRGRDRTGGSYGRYHTHKTPELKFHDFQLNDSTVANTWTVTPSINLIPQGTTEQQRIGRSATIKSIQWKWRVSIKDSTVSTATADVMRMVMYIDEQANGNAATATELFEVDDFQSFRNLANSHRFKILCDNTFAINAQCGGGNGTSEDYGGFFRSGYKQFKVNIPIEWDSTTGAITEIRSNNIGIMVISEAGRLGLESQLRLRFMG